MPATVVCFRYTEPLTCAWCDLSQSVIDAALAYEDASEELALKLAGGPWCKALHFDRWRSARSEQVNGREYLMRMLALSL